MIFITWLLALVTAGWFGLMAWRSGRNVLPWALSGAIFALVTATIVIGLGKATGNPFSDQQAASLHVKWAIEAAVTIAVLGWFVTTPLHRHHLSLWRMLTKKPLPPPPASASAEAKNKPESSKQPVKS